MDKSQKPSFVYVSYINTTAEKLWKALINPEFTKQYWFGTQLQSDWRVGSKCVAAGPDGKAVITGEVLEFDPPRRLSYTWNSMKNEHTGEQASRVTFEIAPEGAHLKLTVTHDRFPDQSTVLPSVSMGWPMVLSNLKTLLETGAAMDLAKPCGAKQEEAAAAR